MSDFLTSAITHHSSLNLVLQVPPRMRREHAKRVRAGSVFGRPRQNTFTRMCQALCKTKDEERRLVAAFAGTELLDEEPDQALPSADKEILRLRAEQFLERKTQSIQFKRSVARELGKAGIEYQQDYCENIYSTDFLIQKGGERICLECKSNIGRDMEKALETARLAGAALGASTIYLVVPYKDGFFDASKLAAKYPEITTCEVSALAYMLTDIEIHT